MLQGLFQKEFTQVYFDVLIVEGRKEIENDDGRISPGRLFDQPDRLGAYESALNVDVVYDFLPSMRGPGHHRRIELSSTIQDGQGDGFSQVCQCSQQVPGVLAGQDHQIPLFGTQV
jgi:hypothetical protein